LPFLGDRNADVSRGGYVVRGGDSTPDLIFIATGSEVSLAIDAASVLEGRGIATRVVSLASFELFEQQDEAYRERILPSSVRAKISVEAASTFGWHRYVGPHGIAIGLDHFGASAPAAALAKAFRFTADEIAERASGLLANV